MLNSAPAELSTPVKHEGALCPSAPLKRTRRVYSRMEAEVDSESDESPSAKRFKNEEVTVQVCYLFYICIKSEELYF